MIERIHAFHGTGVEPSIVEYPTAYAEAQAVADSIQLSLSFDSTAVLARTNMALREIETALAERGVKYHLLGKSGFWQQPEIKNVMAYVCCVAGISDYAISAAIRSPFHPSRYLKKRALLDEAKTSGESVWKVVSNKQDKAAVDFKRFIWGLSAYRNLPAAEVVTSIIRSTKAIEYYHEEEHIAADNNPASNVAELVNVAKRFDSIREFVNFYHRVSNVGKRRAGVALATGHAAKGLEWTNVYVIQATEGVIPHKKASDLTEEQAVLFVMCSRAEEKLQISYSGQKSRFLP